MKSGTTDDPFDEPDDSNQDDQPDDVERVPPDERPIAAAVSDPAGERAPRSLVDAIDAELDAIEHGDRHSHLSVRDQPIAALLAALEDQPADRRDLGDALYETRDREPADDYDRSELLRAALRLGIETAAPEVLEQLGEARARRARDV